MTRAPYAADRHSFAVNLQLSPGHAGAHARVELHERASGRVALVQLAGGLDAPSVDRLARALDDLAFHGVGQLLIDCARLRHIDYRAVPGLARALSRYECRAGGVVVCGLSHYLRDLFRLAGCESGLRCWPSAADLLDDLPAYEATRERAS